MRAMLLHFSKILSLGLAAFFTVKRMQEGLKYSAFNIVYVSTIFFWIPFMQYNLLELFLSKKNLTFLDLVSYEEFSMVT